MRTDVLCIQHFLFDCALAAALRRKKHLLDYLLSVRYCVAIFSLDIWEQATQVTHNIAFFLPKNANIDQVRLDWMRNTATR